MYKVKYNAFGSINKYNARPIAKGYVQLHDIDYDETFTLVAKMTIVYVLLVIVAAKGMASASDGREKCIPAR